MNDILNDKKISPRIWSAILFVGGIFVLLAVSKMHHAPWAFVGYSIWIGFGFRVFWSPALGIRRAFWTLSAIWNAWCLVPAIMLFPLVIGVGGPLGLYPLIGWCLVALIISIWMRGVDSYSEPQKPEAEQ
jgi:hypothetical protein